jgi:antirestriction protein ArdC
MLLAISKFSSPYWMTFKQAIDVGGNVKKGDKSLSSQKFCLSRQI